MQPIIRGIQAVGAVDITYQYNSADHKLHVPEDLIQINGQPVPDIDTTGFKPVAGFRLDGEFLRAVQQIASSVQIPILGGGAVALTNNNRSGTLNINCTKVSTPSPDAAKGGAVGAMYRPDGGAIGPTADNVYDLVFLAQVQQAQKGGDSEGATLHVIFKFCGLYTVIEFQGCTIASVDPVGLAGNDAPNYNVGINYQNWTVNLSSETDTPVTA